MKVRFSEDYKEFARKCGATYDLEKIIDVYFMDKQTGDMYYIGNLGKLTSLPPKGYDIIKEDD